MHATAWSRGLEVTGGGTGVVSHAGLVLLRQLADRTGLTAGLSAALPSPEGGLDRGRVFADLACAIADGARVISDFRVMGDQDEVFGQVASVPTAWRMLKETASGGDRTRRKITAAVNRAAAARLVAGRRPARAAAAGPGRGPAARRASPASGWMLPWCPPIPRKSRLSRISRDSGIIPSWPNATTCASRWPG